MHDSYKQTSTEIFAAKLYIVSRNVNSWQNSCSLHLFTANNFLPVVDNNSVRAFNCANVGRRCGEIVALLTIQLVFAFRRGSTTSAHPLANSSTLCLNLSLDFRRLLELANPLPNLGRSVFVLDGVDGTLHHVLANFVEHLLVGGASALLSDQRILGLLFSRATCSQ